MIHILLGRDGRPSMKKVFSLMKSDSQLTVRRTPPRTKVPYLRIHNNKADAEAYTKRPLSELCLSSIKVIRWGSRIEAETNNKTIVYNKSEAIAKGTNKKLSREIFIKDKVRTPQLVTPESVKESQFPIIARPSTHAKGKNFIVLKTPAEFAEHYRRNEPSGWYYSEFINKTREFRVHCAHGKILGVMEKAKGTDTIAWNRAVTGEPFTSVKQAEYPFSVCIQALKAIKALGLDFGGVDVIAIPSKKDAAKLDGYVLEVNTSPTLNSSDHISEMYAKYFDWLNRSDKRREHWDFTKFETAPSFAWKQFQLMDETKPTMTS